MNMILIPAYEPSNELISLVKELKLANKEILIINDGSAKEYEPLFQTCKHFGATILSHEINQGKGKAIKTGIAYIQNTYPNIDGIITCDADGQHLTKDILHIDETLMKDTDTLILGVRDFQSDAVPRKSRFGNSFSRLYFKLNTGIKCYDTQTGLRGIPKNLFKEALSIEENRYDYEMNFLLEIAKTKKKLIQIPIDTVYLDQNSSSHFRPIMDSIRIYKVPLKFLVIGLLSAAIDLGVFTIISSTLDDLLLKVVLISTMTARIISGGFNFLMNRAWSFKSHLPIHKQFGKYLILYFIIMGLSSLFVYLLSFLPMHLTLVKAMVDAILFIVSYVVQKHWVFKK